MTQAIRYLEHDLSTDELQEFMRLTPTRCSSWRWVRDDAGRIESPVVTHDGTGILGASSWNRDEPRRIVRAVHGAVVRAHQRRVRGAKAAAETRRRRRDSLVYEIVQILRDGGHLQPRINCRLCGRKLTDETSIARGVGTECWQDVLESLAIAEVRA